MVHVVAMVCRNRTCLWYRLRTTTSKHPDLRPSRPPRSGLPRAERAATQRARAVWAGEGIPLGIEFSTTELDDTVNLSTSATNVRGVLNSILGVTRQYSLASARGVVSIRAVGVPPPAWLDHRVRRFRLPRTQISWASIKLWMTVETSMDPAKQGFGGDYPPGDPNDRVGPVDVRDVAVRELLNRIVGTSGHSSWVVTRQGARILPPASVNRLWTTMYRPDPLSELPGPLPPLPPAIVR